MTNIFSTKVRQKYSRHMENPPLSSAPSEGFVFLEELPQIRAKLDSGGGLAAAGGSSF
jgi:hypothetical protein